jgi:TrmH family RNA methyltransferase
MGGHFALNIVEGADLGEYALHHEGTTVALAGEGGRSLYDLDLRGPCAFIVGSEGAGISRSLSSRAKVTARIPTSGKVESLNAGIAGSIALFECARQRTAPKARA